MILVRTSAKPSTIWNVVDSEDLGSATFEEGHCVALKGGSVDELIVFLKSVRPKQIVVYTKDSSVYRTLVSAFTPDKVVPKTQSPNI
ncbi:MAG TPA: hypothetical protein EYH23_01325 [Euryarchaeota archaeon]|nr:hypothetical protein [Euryarchaeota archaeon]